MHTPHTISDALAWATDQLRATSDTPRLDAELLLAHVLGWPRARLLADSVVVRGIGPSDPLGHHNALSFEITARLWAQPYPLELLLKTDLDLETGMVELKDRSGNTIVGQ